MSGQPETRLWARAAEKSRHLGPVIVGVGAAAIILVVFKDVLFRGFHETILGLNSFIAVVSVVLVILAAIVADTRMKNRALSERATKLADMAKRLSATVDHLNKAKAASVATTQARSGPLAGRSQELRAATNAILDNAQVLQGAGDLSQTRARAVAAILAHGERLSRLVEGMVEGSASAADDDITPRRAPAVALPEHLLARLDHAVKAGNAAQSKEMLGEIQSVLKELGELGPEARALSSLIAGHVERADLAAVGEVVRDLEADRLTG